MRKILSLIIFFFFVLNIYAQVNIEKSTEKVIIGGKKYYIHTIEEKQTLFSISKAYEVSAQDIKNVNPGLTDNLQKGQAIKIPILNEKESKETKKDGYIFHEIKPGETLYSLCKQHGISQDEFYKINIDLKKDAKLKAGQIVKFPSNITENTYIDTSKYHNHLVVKGETLYRLTKEYNLTKEEIIEANPGFDEKKLKAGMVLQIPKRNISEVEIITIADSIIGDTLLNPIDDVSHCDSSKWYLNGKNFELSILLPFESSENMKVLYNQDRTNKKQMIKDLSKQMIGFYAGCLSALDNYSSKDINLTVNVYDVGIGNNVISELIDNGKLLNSDIIIGPAFKSQVDFINEKLANENRVFVLPFVNDENILKKYPNNIMITPVNSQVKESILNYVLKQDSDKNIIIIQNSDTESSSISAEYQNLFKQKIGEDRIKTIKYDGKSLVSLNAIVEKNVENIFITTVYDEGSITQILTNLFPLKDYDITFIGNETMLGYETIDPLYYSKVKFTYYTAFNIDYSSEETKKLLKSFRSDFLFEPSNFAFCGYDITNYCINNLIRYGNNFIDCLPENLTYRGEAGYYIFESDINYKPNSYFNKSVYIYKLNPDYKFELVYPDNK